jgi:hypothetical protein
LCYYLLFSLLQSLTIFFNSTLFSPIYLCVKFLMEHLKSGYHNPVNILNIMEFYTLNGWMLHELCLNGDCLKCGCTQNHTRRVKPLMRFSCSVRLLKKKAMALACPIWFKKSNQLWSCYFQNFLVNKTLQSKVILIFQLCSSWFKVFQIEDIRIKFFFFFETCFTMLTRLALNSPSSCKC